MLKLVTLIETHKIFVLKSAQVMEFRERKNKHEVEISKFKIEDLSNTGELKSTTNSLALIVDTQTGNESIVYISPEGCFYLHETAEAIKNILKPEVQHVTGGQFISRSKAFSYRFPRSVFWMHGVDMSDMRDEFFKVSLGHNIAECEPTVLSKVHTAASSEISGMGIFLSDNGSIWYFVSNQDVAYDLTKLIYNNPQLINTVVEESKTLPEVVNLPHRNGELWVAPNLNSRDLANRLVSSATEFNTIPPIHRVATYDKTSRKSMGKYMIPNFGLFGREMIDTQTREKCMNILAGEGAVRMLGEGYELIFSTVDVNAIFVRRRGIFNESKSKEVLTLKPVDDVDVVESATANVSLFPEIEDEKEVAITPVVETKPVTLIKEKPVLEVKHPSPAQLHHWLSVCEEFAQWVGYVDQANFNVIGQGAVTMIKNESGFYTAKELPDGVWVRTEGIWSVLESKMEDEQLVSIDNISLYKQEASIYYTMGTIGFAEPEPVALPVEPKDALYDALKGAMDSMSMAEILGMLSEVAALPEN